MKRNVLAALSALLALSAAGTPLAGFAQEQAPEISPFCSDYSLDSVRLELAPELASVKAGEALLVRGVASNRGSAPVVNGDALIKIYRIEGDSVSMVERFIVRLNASIAAGAAYPFSFPWTVPRSSPSGEYEVTGSFVSGSRISFAHPAWSDAVPAGSARVRVAGAKGGVSFDASSATGNGTILSGERVFSASEPVTVGIGLDSSLPNQAPVIVKWQAYGGFGISAGSIVDSGSQAIVMPPGGIGKAAAVIRDTRFSEYHVVFEARYLDATAYATVSFARAAKPNAAIHSIGLDQGRIFGCVSSSLPGIAKSIDLSLERLGGGTAYEGSIDLGAASTVGFSRSALRGRQASSLILSAVVRDAQGKPLDAVALSYDCKALPALCADVAGAGSRSASLWLMYVAETLVALAGLGFAVSRLRYRKARKL